MKVFTYNPADVAQVGTADFSLRFSSVEASAIDGSILVPERLVEAVRDPESADVIAVPLTLMHFKNRAAMETLPFFSRWPEKHAFFDCSDYEYTYGGVPSILIRCNLRRWMRDVDKNSISWPWPVDDYAECIAPPEDGIRFQVGFHGWTSSTVRKESSNVVKNSGLLKADVVQYDDFTGYIWDTPEGLRRRALFRKNLKESLVQLCPESIPGVFPYRFFEAMSSGRVPVLVSTGYVLPFEDRIPYDDFIVRIAADEASRADVIIAEWLSRHSEARVLELGRQARKWWEEWLQRDRWTKLCTIAVEKLRHL